MAAFASLLSSGMANERIRALIVDDEEPARENLRFMLEDLCPEVNVSGMADGASSARRLIEELDPELVFLDIRMPSGTEGLDLLASLPRPRFLVVFVTAFKDYAVQAFHANAVDYILKPIDPDELRLSVDRALDRVRLFRGRADERDRYREDLGKAVHSVRDQGQRLAVDHARGFKLFDPREISHLEADGNCTVIHFRDGSRYLDTRTLKVYEELLAADRFLRVHRSHVINLDGLKEYLREDGHWALMEDGVRVPIARNRVEDFMAAVRS